LLRFMIGFQLYDLLATTLEPSLRKAEHLAHHGATLITAIYGSDAARPMCLYYCVFFFGIVEISSVPLVLVDLFRQLPTLAGSPLGATLNKCTGVRFRVKVRVRVRGRALTCSDAAHRVGVTLNQERRLELCLRSHRSLTSLHFSIQHTYQPEPSLLIHAASLTHAASLACRCPRSQSRTLFAVSFLALRGVAFPALMVTSYWPDMIAAYRNDDIRCSYFAYGWGWFSSAFLTCLQLYWTAKIVRVIARGNRSGRDHTATAHIET